MDPGATEQNESVKQWTNTRWMVDNYTLVILVLIGDDFDNGYE